MQRGGAARVSTAAPRVHGAAAAPPRSPGAAGPASRGAGAGNPAAPASRGRCPSLPGGPEEGRAGGRRAQLARPPPLGWRVSRGAGRAEQRVRVTPERSSRGSQSPAPGAPGQEKEEARNGEIGLFWRFEALRRAVRGEKRHLPLASSFEGARRPAASRRDPETPPAPGEGGHIATQDAGGAGLGGALAGLHRAQPEEQRGSRRKGKRGQGDRSSRYTPTPPAQPGAAASLWGARPRHLLPTVSQHRGHRGGPWGCPNQGMVAEWLFPPGTSVKAGVRAEPGGDSAQGTPEVQDKGRGCSTQGPERRRGQRGRSKGSGRRRASSGGLGARESLGGAREGRPCQGRRAEEGSVPGGRPRGGGGGARAGHAAPPEPFGRTLPRRAEKAAAAAAASSAAADFHGGSARPGPPPLLPAAPTE